MTAIKIKCVLLTYWINPFFFSNLKFKFQYSPPPTLFLQLCFFFVFTTDNLLWKDSRHILWPRQMFRLLQAFLLISLHKSIYKSKTSISISDQRLKLFVLPIWDARMTLNYKAPCCLWKYNRTSVKFYHVQFHPQSFLNKLIKSKRAASLEKHWWIM